MLGRSSIALSSQCWDDSFTAASSPPLLLLSWGLLLDSDAGLQLCWDDDDATAKTQMGPVPWQMLCEPISG